MTTEVGKKVQGFYNKTPFPDYELSRFNCKGYLAASAWPFAEILDRSIDQDASVIDVGTGTGQLSAFLSLRRKCVWGIDFSDSSLNKAKALKEKLGLNSLHLKKVDILDKKQIEGIGKKFDVVLCLGVLHHTGDAYGGFQNILKLLKPNGLVAVGLYNRFGRLPLKARIILAKTVFKNNQKVKDGFIRMQIGDVEDKERARGWWNDQYLHPHETTHTIGEVLKWFDKNGIEFIQIVPNKPDLGIRGVWNSEPKPNFVSRFFKQLKWIGQLDREGGYWITFGRMKK
ncbi:MAG: class I SAM-dependent methyltransferase [archaeon]